VLVNGLFCYGVYWMGVATGMAKTGIFVGGITFLIIVGIQGYAVFRILQDPTWNPAASPSQIDSQAYSQLTSVAKMLVGSPLSLPVALIKGFKQRKGEESKAAKNSQ
jgi:hypothetical protein